ncbi:MAG: hypothetical protein KIH63_004760 [Candidatus Saccharibacteria bacterium]|nr:hypothetical protein [Candidatus Saccharibacteria bacterium]
MGFFRNILPVAGGIAGGFFGGPAGAALGSGIGGLMGGSRNSEDAANQYLSQIPGIGKQYFDPYITQGREAGDMANAEYGKMLQDPTGFINKILESYKPSQGYQFREKRLQDAASNTAAAGGFRGTNFDVQNQSELINALLGEDMQQYLENVRGVHGTGLAGKENVADRGFQASNSLADLIGGSLNQRGGLAYQRAEGSNGRRNALFSSLLGLGAQGMGFGGGGGFGGFGGGKTVPGSAWR